MLQKLKKLIHYCAMTAAHAFFSVQVDENHRIFSEIPVQIDEMHKLDHKVELKFVEFQQVDETICLYHRDIDLLRDLQVAYHSRICRHEGFVTLATFSSRLARGLKRPGSPQHFQLNLMWSQSSDVVPSLNRGFPQSHKVCNQFCDFMYATISCLMLQPSMESLLTLFHSLETCWSGNGAYYGRYSLTHSSSMTGLWFGVGHWFGDMVLYLVKISANLQVCSSIH